MRTTPESLGRYPAGPLLALLIMGLTGGATAAPPAPAPRSVEAIALPEVNIPDPSPPLPAGSIGDALIPGQVLQPIDLAGTLRLAGARDLDIATARQRVCQAVADLSQARALWLPSLFIGPTYYRADGQIQTITGQVQNINRSSLFLGTDAALANGFPAPSPGTGFPALNGLSSVLRISDAIFEPMAARRVVAAQKAGLQAAANDTILAAAEAYFDLQQASGALAIAREATLNAEALSGLTGAYARTGAGLEADHRRALAELRRRRKEVRGATGRLKVASARLVASLVFDPRLVVAPVEPAETVLRLVADDVPLEDLIAQGLRNRPELAQAREQVEATLVRLKQAKLRPFVPSLALTYAGGGFGGGPGSFFGNFGARGDAAASLFWDLRNLGFTDIAIVHRRQAERRTADIDLVRVQAQVAQDVVASQEARIAASAEMSEASPAVIEAVESLNLNLTNIRRGAGLPGATRAIEVLQPIQALAQARADYLDAVLAYNRAQFRLFHALGQAPALSPPPSPPAMANTLATPPSPRP